MPYSKKTNKKAVKNDGFLDDSAARN